MAWEVEITDQAIEWYRSLTEDEQDAVEVARRMAILLVGGDKTDRWDEWYRDNVPVAERLYDEHLPEIGRSACRR